LHVHAVKSGNVVQYIVNNGLPLRAEAADAVSAAPSILACSVYEPFGGGAKDLQASVTLSLATDRNSWR
jgi:hypothetical protein